jgi:monoterpene epsilon-lactone hydrolase
MASVQAVILNSIFKCTAKPYLKYQAKKYLRTNDVGVIKKFRKRIDQLAAIIPSRAHILPLEFNGISVMQISADATSPKRTIVYLHGGAYVFCSWKTHLHLAYKLAVACDAKVLLIDYRLAPENKFPAALLDVLTAYEAIIQANADDHPLFIAGDSSGGGLTLATLLALRDKGLPMPKAGICLSPWADLTFSGTSLQFNRTTESILPNLVVQFYAHEKDCSNPLVSPIYADFTGLPPLFIQVSSSEILLDDAKRVTESAKKSGVKVELEIWDGLPHVWHFCAGILPEGKQALQNINKFMNNLS